MSDEFATRIPHLADAPDPTAVLDGPPAATAGPGRASVANRAAHEPGIAPGSRLGRRRSKGRWRTARRFVVPLVLVVLWQWGHLVGIDVRSDLSTPYGVAKAARQLSGSGQLWSDLAASLRRAGLGLALGGIGGLLLGVLAGLSRLGEDAVDATIQMLRTLPFLALVPLFVIMFGIGETPKVGLVALACLPPIYVNTFAGIRSIDRKLIEMAQTVRFTRAQLVLRVLLPGALPSVLVGLRYSLTFSLLALVAAEQINATTGLGALLVDAQQQFRTDQIVLVLVIYALLGLLVDFAVRGLERILLSWRAVYAGGGR